MANQSILLALRKMWEYFTVPPQGDLGFASEEHDPVGEFLEQHSRGGELIEAETETETEREELPIGDFEPETEISQATADESPSSVEVPEAEPSASLIGSESEALPPAVDIGQNETEDEMIQEMTDNENGQVENEVVPQLSDTTTDAAGDEVAEETAEDGNKGADDDLLDIFRNEKEQKEADALHDSLTDVDIQELLQESKDLMAELNSRRYRKA